MIDVREVVGSSKDDVAEMGAAKKRSEGPKLIL